jgi:hypothetical protein
VQPQAVSTSSSKARVVRLGVLLMALVVTSFFAVGNVRARQARKTWDHSLDIAIVLVGAADPRAVAKLKLRSEALGDKFTSELGRYRPGAPRPFRFVVFGPLAAPGPMPKPTSGGTLDVFRFTWDSYLATRELNARAEITRSQFDSTMYVYIAPPASDERASVEGLSDRNGRVGLVQVELDESMVDTALFVIGHELLHTLGATDRYDETGKTLIPSGFAEPNRVPLYPQRFAEVMARNRPLSPTLEVIPQSLDELLVGELTAQEIEWQK